MIGKMLLSLFALAMATMPAMAQEPAAAPQHPGVSKHVWNANVKKTFHLHDREKMKVGHPTVKFNAKAIPAPAKTVFDWSGSLSFPMYANDTEGDCYLAGLGHAVGSITGNVPPLTEMLFTDAAVVSQYTQVSGGDNGLSDGDAISIWKSGVAGNKAATIIDELSIDMADDTTVTAAMYYFGHTMVALALTDQWYQDFTGSGNDVWDTGKADPQDGHAIMLNGRRVVGTTAQYDGKTWASNIWLTQNGIKVSGATGWIGFSLQWFDPKTGLAPNGIHIVTLAQYWQAAGGKAIPASIIAAFPPPSTPPNPPPPPPSGSSGKLILQIPGQPDQSWTFPLPTAPTGKAVPEATPQELVDALNKVFGAPAKQPAKKEPAKKEPAKKVADDGKSRILVRMPWAFQAVTLDGRDRNTSPGVREFIVAPGEHTLTGEYSGDQILTRRVTVAAGETATVEFPRE